MYPRLKIAKTLFIAFALITGVMVVGSVLTAAGCNPIMAFIVPIIALGIGEEIRRRL